GRVGNVGENLQEFGSGRRDRNERDTASGSNSPARSGRGPRAHALAGREGDGARGYELAAGDLASLEKRGCTGRGSYVSGENSRAHDIRADTEWQRLASRRFSGGNSRACGC